jgi:uncharacterized protein YndB with AHSA1/START domain
MRLASRTDIAAPATGVFAVLTDLDRLEEGARQAGVRLRRSDTGQGLVLGATWQSQFVWRGRERAAECTVERIDPPRSIRLGTRSGNYACTIDLTLAPLSRTLTRMAVVMEVKPLSVGARLVLQTLRIGRSRLELRLDRRVEGAGRMITKWASTL